MSDELDVFTRRTVEGLVLAAMDQLLDLNPDETPTRIKGAVSDVYGTLAMARELLGGVAPVPEYTTPASTRTRQPQEER